MSDEFTNATTPRLNASVKSSGWVGPFRSLASEREPTSVDEAYAAAQRDLEAVSAETERTKELVFAAKDRLALAGTNGERPGAEEALSEARRAWEAAVAAEEKARSRVVSLGVARSDERRARSLSGGA